MVWTFALQAEFAPAVALLADLDGVYGSQHDERINSYSALFGPKFKAVMTVAYRIYGGTLFAMIWNSSSDNGSWRKVAQPSRGRFVADGASDP